MKLRQKLAAAHEELRDAEAEPKVKYTTGSTAEQQEARDKASTAKSGKKRTLKKNVLTLEAAVEDECYGLAASRRRSRPDEPLGLYSSYPKHVLGINHFDS